jgi:hypothetical protein
MGYLAIMVGFNGLMRGSEFVYKKPGKVENSHGKVVGGVVPFTGGHVTFRSNTKRNGVEGLSCYRSEIAQVWEQQWPAAPPPPQCGPFLEQCQE